MRWTWRDRLGAVAGAGAALAVLALSWWLGAGGPRAAADGAAYAVPGLGGIRIQGAAAADPVPLALPPPTGTRALGAIELHLVDRDRPDPWHPDQPREVMVTVWYPARHGGDERRPFPYLPPGAAAAFEHGGLADVDVTPAQVEIADLRTHARSAAPVDARGGPHPVVLFSPGGGVSRTAGTVLVEELASRGTVVVTVDHTHEAAQVEFPGGRVVVGEQLRGTPNVLRQLLDTRVADLRFVLDQLEVLADGGNPDAGGRTLPEGLGGVLDLARVGAFGHSAGGFAAAETMLVDQRVDAGANLDGSLAYDLPHGLGAVAQRGLDRPFLLMGAGASGPDDDRPHSHRTAPDWGEFWRRSTGWKMDVTLRGATHGSFTDLQALLPQLDRALDLDDDDVATAIGTIDPDRSVAAQRAYLTALFDQHLRGRPQPLLDGRGTSRVGPPGHTRRALDPDIHTAGVGQMRLPKMARDHSTASR